MTNASLTTLVSLNLPHFDRPTGDLITDAAGDLFGTTYDDGTNGYGAVFEIAKTGDGYASAPTTVASFNGAHGSFPYAGLIADAAGDLFGTTVQGGADGEGAVFEIAKTSDGYASTPTVLASFGGSNGNNPYAGLVADAAGNLFGTTSGGGAHGYGTVFEIAKGNSGYASKPTVLASFNGADGANPYAGLIADAAGDLFGTTSAGGAHGDGDVFEIAKTKAGYASTPTVLTSFNGADGGVPRGGLIADAAGNLFGTTYQGGAEGDGEVFEITRTETGYAKQPKILASFDGANGAYPLAGLIADAAGDLFGTTSAGGADGDGEVFEIAKTGHKYASTPTILKSFTGSNGSNPAAGLTVDAAGNLFGTTEAGGAHGDGTVFSLTNAGFKVDPTAPGGIDLAALGYKSSFEAVWNPETDLLKIVDKANSGVAVATLSIAGTLSGGLVRLSRELGDRHKSRFRARSARLGRAGRYRVFECFRPQLFGLRKALPERRLCRDGLFHHGHNRPILYVGGGAARSRRQAGNHPDRKHERNLHAQRP